MSTCFYTNVNAWVYTCVCERACVHKVPPCKRLIVCVGNNSPIPQGMKQARKRPGPQTSGGPPGHGTPRRTTAGTTAASTQKGQRRARRRDLRHFDFYLHACIYTELNKYILEFLEEKHLPLELTPLEFQCECWKTRPKYLISSKMSLLEATLRKSWFTLHVCHKIMQFLTWVAHFGCYSMICLQ